MPPLKRTRTIKAGAARSSSKRAKTVDSNAKAERSLVRAANTPAGGPRYGWPAEHTLSFHYDYVSGIQTGVGGAHVTQIFRLNSLYDPDQTGLGAQPAGFDQFAALYMKYYVKKCTINIEYHNCTGSNNLGMMACTTYPSQQAASSATAFTAMNQANSKTAFLMNHSKARHVISTSPSLFTGHADRDDTLCSLCTTNPSQQCFWVSEIWVDPAQPVNYYVSARVTYYVTMFAPIQPSDS